MIKQILAYSLILYTLFCAFTYGNSTQKIETYFHNLKDFGGVVGITKKGKTIFKKAYGYADRERHTFNDFTTKFPIASNTKSFTAVAIMLLHEKGLLNVADKVSNYIPGIPDNTTIHHLLAHTSGIPNYYKHWDDMRASSNCDDIVKHIAAWNLEFAPGTAYAYSNSGYFLLACIVEKVSGKQFGEFLTEHIFKPLGMSNNGSICVTDDMTLSVIDKKAFGYVKQNGTTIAAPAIQQPLTLLGNGDLYASIDDMLSWVEGLFTGKVIDSKSLELLLCPHIAMENSSDRFHAYGWFIDIVDGKRVAEYNGALVGYVSKVIRFIDDEITIIIMTNVEDHDMFCKICDDLPKMIK